MLGLEGREQGELRGQERDFFLQDVIHDLGLEGYSITVNFKNACF